VRSCSIARNRSVRHASALRPSIRAGGVDLLTTCGLCRAATCPSRQGDAAEDRARTATTFLWNSHTARGEERTGVAWPTLGACNCLLSVLVPAAHHGNRDTAQPPRPPRPSLSICCHHSDDPKVAAWVLDVRAAIAIHVAIRQSATFLMTASFCWALALAMYPAARQPHSGAHLIFPHGNYSG
jgi:hypothetical protein